VKLFHPWHVGLDEAIEIQKKLASKVIRKDDPRIKNIKAIVGVDVSTDKENTYAAAVVMEFPSLKIVEISIEKGLLEVPYIPGFLSFREAPLILKALERIKHSYEVILVDGNGIAHPRRLGIASHIGVLLQIPTIGCAKTKLIGEYKMPDEKKGSWSLWKDNDEVIGAVVRTRDKVKPLYISVGHLISLKSAIEITLACCKGYRLPEPIREAHKRVNQARREDGRR